MQLKLNLKRRIREPQPDGSPETTSPCSELEDDRVAFNLRICEPIKTVRRPRKEVVEELHFPPLVWIPRLKENLCEACLLPLIEDTHALAADIYSDKVLGSVGLISSCHHCYHVDCITKWTDIENSCPQCKARYHALAHYNLVSCLHVCNQTDQAPQDDTLQTLLRFVCGTRADWLPTKKKDQTPDDITVELAAEDDVCDVCGSGHDPSTILICDGASGLCQRTFHWMCLGYKELPRVAHWFCPNCVESETLTTQEGRAYAVRTVIKRQNAFLEFPVEVPPNPNKAARKRARVDPEPEMERQHPLDLEEGRFCLEVEHNTRYLEDAVKSHEERVSGAKALAELLRSSADERRSVEEYTPTPASPAKPSPQSVPDRLGTLEKIPGRTTTVLEAILDQGEAHGSRSTNATARRLAEQADVARRMEIHSARVAEFRRQRVEERHSRRGPSTRREEGNPSHGLVDFVKKELYDHRELQSLRARDYEKYRSAFKLICQKASKKLHEKVSRSPYDSFHDIMHNDEKFRRYAKEVVAYCTSKTLR
ncbi:MAG: hypothetical protein KVP17_004712 [Porospora cf. gigantea B]|uniref:uncharacterized protein n=1 Tax=Porospora cf. gigantea B TaxID=2853592 RepID=UPI003571AB98|nr:MAG: hypothetical protein KVP17_004712 [Porospora cf. gigantea B]